MGLKKIKMGIIGAGNMADEHLRAFKSIPGISLVGIYSKTKEKAENLAKKYQITNVFSSIEDLYNNTKAELLIVAVTETSLKLLIDDILRFEWTVLIEKPIGLSFQECIAFNEKVLITRKKNIFIALNRRFYASTQYVLSDLKHSKGKRFIHVVDHQSLNIAKSLNYSSEIINSWMYKNSVHTIDYFNFMSKSEVKSINVIQKWDPKILNPVLAQIFYENGDEGLYQGIWHGPGPWSVSVTTEENYFEMKPLETAVVRSRDSYASKVYPTSDADKIFKPGLKNQAEELIRYLKGESNNLVTVANAFKTMEILHSIYEQ